MKIIVCMKQVPASSKVDIDPETGNLKRGSAGQRTNPYDLYALECALHPRKNRRHRYGADHGTWAGREHDP